jgi:uridine kinase
MNTLAPRLIAIVGGSGSGKSWLTSQLLERLAATAAAVSLDSFYQDRAALSPARREQVNYDQPRAIDWKAFKDFARDCKLGRPASLPQYNFQNHTRRSDSRLFEPRPLVIVEGLWLLVRPDIRTLFDYSIYLECPAETRLRQRLERDTRERGRSAETVRRQFSQTVAPMYARHVAPQRTRANLVLEQPMSVEAARRLAVYLRCWLSHWALNPGAARVVWRPASFPSLTLTVNHE